MASTEVVRWAPMVYTALSSIGMNPREYLGLMLSQMSMEGAGNPSAYHSGSSAFGLGGTRQYRPDGTPYYGGSKHGGPYVASNVSIAGAPLTWNPRDQINASVAVMASHGRLAKWHKPSMAHAYASGSGNIRDVIKGDMPGGNIPRQHTKYVPVMFFHRYPDYEAWAQDWMDAGRPQKSGVIQAGRGGEGGHYNVTLARGITRERQPKDIKQPFDGWLQYRDKPPSKEMLRARPPAWEKLAPEGRPISRLTKALLAAVAMAFALYTIKTRVKL